MATFLVHKHLNRSEFSFLAWLPAAFAAATTTYFLVALMHVLVAAPTVEAIDPPVYKIVDPVLTEKIIETLKPDPRPTKVAVEPEPVITIPHQALDIDSDESGGIFEPVKADLGNKATLTMAPSNLPVARMMMAPEYPANAARKRIEGFVDVRFDITKTGATANVEAVAASPEGVFEKAAISAVKRWKFAPSIQDGQEVEFYGMQKRVVFEMEK